MSGSSVGIVYLVGAGPGDPGLISVRGVECLQKADVVLYDGLVNPILLQHTHAQAERTCRTKGPHGSFLNQDEINSRLIEAAKEGKTVVRLKGGDPYIFGRGGEESAALVDAGIPFEVVPGITAATAASEYAGISLTHRRYSSSIAFVSGHEDPSKETELLDYRNLAAFSGTLVFYMGLHRLEGIVDSLLEAGKSPTTPACVISRATTPLQRTVQATLGELAGKVRSENINAPSLILVGDCVAQREKIAWFEKRPLFGLSIGVTRPIEQSQESIREIWDLGAMPILMPTIEIQPPQDWNEVDRAIEKLDEFDWLVFTSTNGAEFFLNRLETLGFDLRKLGHLKLSVVGSSTRETLKKYRLSADIVPEEFHAESLVEALSSFVGGKKVLWPKADRARDVLPRGLRSHGAILEEIVVYRNCDVTEFPSEVHEQLVNGGIDWVGLSSPAIARNFARLVEKIPQKDSLDGMRLATIGPLTTHAAQEAGLTVHTEATEQTWSGILSAIAEQQKV